MIILINIFLITKKQVDFELFKKAFYLLQNKEHLTENGLCKIISFRASINLGLSDELTSAFPNITPMERSLVLSPKIVNPKWLTGFITGEGCFL